MDASDFFASDWQDSSISVSPSLSYQNCFYPNPIQSFNLSLIPTSPFPSLPTTVDCTNDANPSLPLPHPLITTTTSSSSLNSINNAGGNSSSDSSFMSPSSPSLSPVSSSTVTSEREPRERSNSKRPSEQIDGATLKKLKHRSIDANRRAREAAALSSLQKLTNVAVVSENSQPRNSQKKDKVGIMEEAAQRMSELLSIIKRLESNLDEEKRKNIQLQKELHDESIGLVNAHLRDIKDEVDNANGTSNTSASMLALSNVNGLHGGHTNEECRAFYHSHVLFRSVFNECSLMFLIISAKSGRCTDVNDPFVRRTGWKRQQIVGNRFCSPLADWKSAGAESRLFVGCPLRPEGWRDDKSATGQLQTPSLNAAQFPSTIKMLMRLYDGQDDIIVINVMAIIASGRRCLVQAHVWLGGGRETDEGLVDAKHLIVAVPPDRVSFLD